MSAERVDVDCPRCDGRGYPNIGQDGTLWDEELQQRHVYICSRCGGSGVLRLWADDPQLAAHIAAIATERRATR